MHRYMSLALVGCLFFALGGCGFLGNLVGRTETTVLLFNDGDFDVHVELFISEQRDVNRDLIRLVGEKQEYTIAPGETIRIRRDCDDIGAVLIDDAELRIIGGVGPNRSSNVLSEGSQFRCGETITFTFDHSGLIVDFDIVVSVSG